MSTESEKKALERFLAADDQAAVVEAIRTAEQTTSGQIKVHIEPTCREQDPYTRAVDVFGQLGLEKTRQRNAVLIYIASEDRRFAFAGDTGIHAEVGDPFWGDATAALSHHFRAAQFREGLVAAVAAVGKRLAAAFPHTPADENELSDEITTGDPSAPKS